MHIHQLLGVIQNNASTCIQTYAGTCMQNIIFQVSIVQVVRAQASVIVAVLARDCMYISPSLASTFESTSMIVCSSRHKIYTQTVSTWDGLK